jgi:hypothetical protein
MKNILSFLRWNLKITRKFEGLLNYIKNSSKIFNYKKIHFSSNHIINEFKLKAFLKLENKLEVPKINLKNLLGKAKDKAFVDIINDYKTEVSDVFISLMKIPGLEDAIAGYFNGKPWLWNCALNYSDPSKAQTSSKMWHFDYGDKKQMHLMIYISDVHLESGPFTFLPLDISKKVKRNLFTIERYTDESLLTVKGVDGIKCQTKLVGDKGDVFIADPGKLMHQGARASKPRLVMFVTFTSPAPTSTGGDSTMSQIFRKELWNKYQLNHSEGKLTYSTFK